MKKQNEKKLLTPGKISAALLLAGGIFTSLGYPFFRFIVCAKKKKKTNSDPNRKKWFHLKHTEINHPKNGFEQEYEESKAWCQEQPMEDWHIRSEDGLMLHASYYPAEDAERIVLLSHGYRGTRFGSVAHIARFLHENHTDLLFIDQRCCGESEGRYITFGAKEQKDILAWIARLQEQNPKKLPIYLYGQSMGGTAVLLAAGNELPEEVHGLIVECGFHSMKQQMKDIAAGWFHLHRIGLLLLRLNLFCRLLAGFRMKETDTTEALRRNTRPVLFFHGESDTYVWPENSRRNYQLCRAPKKLVLIPEARHLCCSYAAPDLYRKEIMDFFASYDRSSV